MVSNVPPFYVQLWQRKYCLCIHLWLRMLFNYINWKIVLFFHIKYSYLVYRGELCMSGEKWCGVNWRDLCEVSCGEVLGGKIAM